MLLMCVQMRWWCDEFQARRCVDHSRKKNTCCFSGTVIFSVLGSEGPRKTTLETRSKGSIHTTLHRIFSLSMECRKEINVTDRSPYLVDCGSSQLSACVFLPNCHSRTTRKSPNTPATGLDGARSSCGKSTRNAMPKFVPYIDAVAC